jgi:hypothetical protein
MVSMAQHRLDLLAPQPANRNRRRHAGAAHNRRIRHGVRPMTATATRLLAFAGSLRDGWYNRRLLPVLAEGARVAGARVTLIELRDYPVPVYDGDIAAAQALARVSAAAQVSA